MTDYFTTAKAITRAAFPPRITYEQACHQNYPSSTCWVCYAPCNPHTREFRGNRVCPSCYDELPPLLEVKKEKQP
jgi:hypothetical protein